MIESVPELFKYNPLITTPLFLIVLYLLLHKAKGFSYSQLTVSRSIHLLSPMRRNLFRANFIVKAIFDAGFVWYLAVAFGSVSSPPALLWMAAIVSFGLFAYFTDDRSRSQHNVFVYSWIALWLMLELVSAWYTRNGAFILTTTFIVGAQAALSVFAGILKRTNVIIQGSCVVLLYLWLILFVQNLSQL